ncbi:MAG: hypothetical protein AB1673_16515 [Actinomycetota bacterium]
MAERAHPVTRQGPTDPELRARVREWARELTTSDLRWAAEELAAASAALAHAAEAAGPPRSPTVHSGPGAAQDDHPRPRLFGPSAVALADRAAELAEHERALSERERRLERARDELVAAQRSPTTRPAWSVPAAAAAVQLHALIVDTGDDVATVARGLGVEPEWAAGVLSGEVESVDIVHVQALCEGLHCTPYDLFGADAARSIDHAYGPELWPRYIEPLDPVGPPALAGAGPGAGPFPVVGEAPEASVATVAAELRTLVVQRGEDVADVAAGLGLDEDGARALLRGELTALAPAHERLGQGLDHTGPRPVPGHGPAPAPDADGPTPSAPELETGL